MRIKRERSLLGQRTSCPLRLGALLLAALAFGGAASAATVTESEARAAASAFIVADPVGSAVLRGRTVSTVYERDGLWIAALSPSGHVILSGSDLGDPIVGFSTNDFAEPDPDSPAYAYLAGISASLTAQEAKAIDVTVTLPGGATADDWYATVVNGRLSIVNPHPGGFTLILR